MHVGGHLVATDDSLAEDPVGGEPQAEAEEPEGHAQRLRGVIPGAIVVRVPPGAHSWKS